MKYRILQAFTREFVADVGVENLHKYAAGPDGTRIENPTLVRKWEPEEQPIDTPQYDGADWWIIEGEGVDD